MADELYKPQIQYQSRDYTSLRDDMLDLIPNFAPQWTSRDTTDFGIVMIELFSYMGDILNYYIDRAANEGFLATATQRETVLNLARLLGYTPKPPVANQERIIATNSAVVSTVTTGAKFSTTTTINGNYIYYEYLGTTATVAANATAQFLVTEGATVAYKQIGVSDGSPDQTFPIYSDKLVYSDNLNIYVGGSVSTSGTPSGGSLYTSIVNILDASSTDEKYATYYDGNGIINIRFGDGVSGKVPPINSPIFASYREGFGSQGNIGNAVTLNTVSGVTGGTLSVSTKDTLKDGTEQVGADPESMDSIRLNAPLSLRAVERAVSLSDYSALAIKSSPLVYKANAVADNFNSVVIFVMGKDWSTLDSNTLTTVKQYFNGKTPPGTMLTVVNGTTAFPLINVNVRAYPTYSNASVKAAAEAAIKDLLSFDNVFFNDLISQDDINLALKNLDGVSRIKMVGLERNTVVGTTTTLNDYAYFYVNEVPKYASAGIKVTVTGGVS